MGRELFDIDDNDFELGCQYLGIQAFQKVFVGVVSAADLPDLLALLFLHGPEGRPSFVCLEVVLLELLSDRQFQVNLPQLDQIVEQSLFIACKNLPQHESQVCGESVDFLFLAQFLDNCDRLQYKEFMFVFLLRMERPAPHQQPAVQDVCTFVLLVELCLQLISSSVFLGVRLRYRDLTSA